MARDKSTPPVEGVDFDSLPEITDMQLNYILNLEVKGMDQLEAFAQAGYSTTLPDGTKRSENSMRVEASRLANQDNLKAWREYFKESTIKRAELERDTLIARMMRLAYLCERSGNYGAAVKAEENIGKILGVYIDKREDVNKSRDQLESLKTIARSLGEETAMNMAKKCGLQKELTEALKIIH
jgi:hypothetical protein